MSKSDYRDGFLLEIELLGMAAAAYEARGYDVAVEVPLHGVRLDLLATRRQGPIELRRVAIEVKGGQRPVTEQQIVHFWGVLNKLTDTKDVRSGDFISAFGFTEPALAVAEAVGIRTLTLESLSQWSSPDRLLIKKHSELATQRLKDRKGESGRPYLFVLMPFEPSFEDVYLL
jgi:hypothetical protein